MVAPLLLPIPTFPARQVEVNSEPSRTNQVDTSTSVVFILKTRNLTMPVQQLMFKVTYRLHFAQYDHQTLT